MAYELVDPLPDVPLTNLETSFERLYVPDSGGVQGNDQALYLHPNGLCLIGMAPAHAVFCSPPREALTDAAAAREADSVPESIDFDVGRSNLLHAEFRKGRGPWLNPDAALCRVTVNGKVYLLRSLVKGPLVDVNEQLADAQGPGLLKVLRSSYIAVVSPKQEEVARLRKECLAQEKYAELRGVPISALG